MIHTKDLYWKYSDKKVLEDVNIDFELGKVYSIIGPNGSGKTTLLKSLLKILKPKAKTVFIENEDILNIKSKKIAQKISYVPQIAKNDIALTVFDTVLMGRSPFLKKFESESKEDIELAEKSMKITNIFDYKDRRLNELSGGEYQRVIIARALTQTPEILFLDEPLSNLDLHHQIEIMDLLRFLNCEKKLTVILVVHDLNVALQYSDKIILMNKGRIIDCDEPKEIILNKELKEIYKMDFSFVEIEDQKIPYLIPKIDQFSFEK